MDERCTVVGYRWLRLPWSVILTLNVGLDDAPIFDDLPLWHCSISLLAPSGAPLALDVWNDDAFVECHRFIRDELLAGVGDSAREHVQIGDTALHFRRCSSDREVEELNGRGVRPRPRDRARSNRSFGLTTSNLRCIRVRSRLRRVHKTNEIISGRRGSRKLGLPLQRK